PQSVDDVKEVFTNAQKYPEQNAYLRQVVSYWEMVAAMVNHGSIDRGLFFDTNGEFFGVWAKIGDFIEGFGASLGPHLLANLEELIASAPDGAKRVQVMKERFNSMAAQRARK